MSMADKVAQIMPEITLGIGACVCLAMGLARTATVRQATSVAAFVALLLAGVFTVTNTEALHTMPAFVKLATVVVGLLLLLVVRQLPESWPGTQHEDDARQPFEPADAMRGEFFAFFLFSLAGVMLCAGAGDLVWLFLALELTSLPTYIMVATSRRKLLAQESGVKYFFLGAMAVAMFLYGFAFIFGATGHTELALIQAHVAEQGVSNLMLLGLVLSVVGISFKIAAFPMHFYAADVYQGAATPVTAFLAFVPKTAGFVSLILIVSLAGWPLRETAEPLMWVLWIMAAFTMTLGNVLGLLQQSVKRMLAYSSIAHSGYMLVGLVAGATISQTGAMTNGVAAILFYLVAYGLANLGAFGVLACLSRRGEEAETYDDLAGLSRRHPLLAGIMALSLLSLIGLPPAVGFLGKIYLFSPAINAGFTVLVVIALLNSAISAAYYLRAAAACFFGSPDEDVQIDARLPRVVGMTIAAVAALVLGVFGGTLVNSADRAGRDHIAALREPVRIADTAAIASDTQADAAVAQP